MDYKETIKERLKILPDELKDFVLSESWRIDAENIGREFALNEEDCAVLENEIFLTLIFFQPRSDFNQNIQRELGADSMTSKWIAEDVEKVIFSQVSDVLDEVDKQLDLGKSKENKTSNNIGQSFEEMILNQARAMQPAKPAEPALGIMNNELGIMGEKDHAPENLPVEKEIEKPEQRQQNKPWQNPFASPPSSNNKSEGYKSGEDPYREPIE